MPKTMRSNSESKAKTSSIKKSSIWTKEDEEKTPQWGLFEDEDDSLDIDKDSDMEIDTSYQDDLDEGKDFDRHH